MGLTVVRILGHHAVQRTAAGFDIPHDTTQDADIGVGIHKDLDVHLVAKLLGGKDQDAFHNDDGRRIDSDRVVAAVVDGVVVNRDLDALPGAQLLQMFDH